MSTRITPRQHAPPRQHDFDVSTCFRVNAPRTAPTRPSASAHLSPCPHASVWTHLTACRHAPLRQHASVRVHTVLCQDASRRANTPPPASARLNPCPHGPVSTQRLTPRQHAPPHRYASTRVTPKCQQHTPHSAGMHPPCQHASPHTPKMKKISRNIAAITPKIAPTFIYSSTRFFHFYFSLILLFMYNLHFFSKCQYSSKCHATFV